MENEVIGRILTKVLKKEYPDENKYKDKEDALRNKEVKALLFDPYLRCTNNMKNGNNAITNFFPMGGKPPQTPH